MKLAREAPPDRCYQEPWPFACPLEIYRLKRANWLEAARVLRQINPDNVTPGDRRPFGQRTAQIELMHLRNAYYRPPAAPYPYRLEVSAHD